MKRKNFLKAGALAALSGVVGTKLNATPSPNSRRFVNADEETPEIIKSYTTADHRIRLESIAFGEMRITNCVRKFLITSYIPGHAVFEPSNANWEPNDKDDKQLGNLKKIGIGIIQPWSKWATCWGQNYLVAKNPEGFRSCLS